MTDETLHDPKMRHDYVQTLESRKPGRLRKFAVRWKGKKESKSLGINLNQLATAQDRHVAITMWTLIQRTPELSHLHDDATIELHNFTRTQSVKTQNRRTQARADVR